MGKIPMNLQDSFLNAARRQNAIVTIALNDGTKLKGKVNGFDNYIVVLDVNRVQHLVYKHAIATIFPDRPLEKHHHVPTPASPSTVVEPDKSNVSSGDLEKFKVTMESK